SLPPQAELPAISHTVEDDAYDLQTGDKVVLIIEDDERFASVLLDIAHEKGFKGLIALKGDQGLSMAHEYTPDAIVLDINLPVFNGWTLLDRLKHHPRTRHIPVHVISVVEERRRGKRLGAFAYLVKPVSAQALDDAFARLASFINRKVKNL